MGRIKTFANGGTVLPGDLNSIQDDYETAFSVYRPIRFSAAAMTNRGAATYVLSTEVGDTGSVTNTGAQVPGSSAPGYAYAFYVDPADLTGGPRTAKFRLRVGVLPNNDAPGVNFTFGLYPVSSWGGATTTPTYINGLGTVQSGSTVAINTPSALTPAVAVTSDFTLTAGWYALGVLTSGGFSSSIGVKSQLQHRSV